jgi:glycosyltransferase 2 family protein
MDQKPEQKNGQGYFDFKKILKSILILVFAGIALNIFATLLFDKDKVLKSLSTVPWYGVAVPFLCVFMIFIIDAVRMKLLLWQFGERISFGDAYLNTTVGYFFNYLTPLGAGQQPFMIYHLTALGHDSKTSTNIVFSRYVVYTLSVFVLLVAFMRDSFHVADSIHIGRFVIILGMLTSTVLSVGVLFLLIKPYFVGKLALRIEKTRLGRFISMTQKKDTWAEELYTWSMDLRENITYLWRKKLPFMIIDIALNLADTLLMAFSVYFVVSSINPVPISFVNILVTYLIVSIVVHYIPTPGGTGGYEAALTLILSEFLSNTSLAVSTTLVWRFCTYYLQILFCGIMFMYFQRNSRKMKLREANPAAVDLKK